MKVLHLQYFSTPSGNYTITLHDLMNKHGIDSSTLSLTSNFKPSDNKIKWLGKIPNFKAEIDYKIQEFLNYKNNRDLGGFTYPIFGTNISKHHLVKNADIIYVHWILFGFLNINNLRQLAKLGKPMVFVLHDMWFFTGGCHHSFDCNKFMVECKDCQILQQSIFDRANLLFDKKKNFFNSFDNLYFIAPSVWMQNKAESSALLKSKKIFQVYNSVSTNFIKLKENSFREENNIGKEKKIIGFGANYINNPYKGFQYLLAALKILAEDNKEENWEVLIFGSDLSDKIIQEIPFKVHYTGYLSSEIEICKAYNAMDVFVVSSIADNLPTTVLESLQCGTPIAGFSTGGIPEMVKHQKNGYLAKKCDIEDLSRGIKYCLENSIHGYLNQEFSQTEIVDKHLEVFHYVFQNQEKE
ncbi:MAG TPA: glycosyltransferase [Lunatimonas sp.]|nr:glycosyltransferase [Lunatimonas sp.]